MPRDNFSQLPSSDELKKILDAESKRDIPAGKEETHYFDFAPLIRVGEVFGIDTAVMVKSYSREDLKEQDIFAHGKEFVERMREKVLGRELSGGEVEVLNGTYDYLAEEDVTEKADLIFVFGAKTPLRIEKAVELYRAGLGDKIVVSGRGPFYGDQNAKTEAAINADIAMSKGVPAEVIIVEDESITVPDNVRSSLNLLDEKGVSYRSIILVNSPYTQRRGWAHFKKYTPESVKIIRVNCGTGEQYRRDVWYRSPAGIDVVLSEYFKAKVAVSLNTA